MKRTVGTIGKMHTPQYILDIRNGKYTEETAVAKILKECGFNDFPINPWNIARQLNFEIFEMNFPKNNISGVMVDSAKVPKKLERFQCKRAIILNRAEDKKMQSFTIAHELGHFVYSCNEKENYFSAYHISRDKTDEEMTSIDKKTKEEEDKMDRFAAMLLMPAKLFKRCVLYEVYWENKQVLTEKMSKICVVPKEAIEKRYEELGLDLLF